VVGSTSTDNSEDLAVFAQELASRLRVFKLILLDRAGGLLAEDGARMSFVESKRVVRALKRAGTRLRRKIVRLASDALSDGVGSVNLVSPRGVYEELFSFTGLGTLFTPAQYATVFPISIDDFEEAEALILRAQDDGFLLARSADQIAQLLPSCFGYRVGDEHLAGICSLLTDPYRRDRAGEITALYTLTRFQGEGVAAELIKEIVKEASARKLKYVFACTSEERAARFFQRIKFRRVGRDKVSAQKWRGYDSNRIDRLSIFRLDLAR
jgi:N-acetylglutamate synthase-like GNAT family acetyltransferase